MINSLPLNKNDTAIIMKTASNIFKAILFALILLFFSSPSMAQQAQNTNYPDDAAFNMRKESERGLIIERTFNNSTIYPGTSRKIQIYIPTQYSGKAPACLLVCLDGIVYNKMTTVMDNLIASGEMPITIGVFVNPGVIYDNNGNILRYNRSNEFDRIDGTFARFLETEILPMVKNITLEDGRKLKISTQATDHAITGASSGGICSFVAAWSRPDLFSRVYCTVGTFVSMRGGNTLPALIRKTEPKALRIYLHDGEYDAWNPLFGDWFEYNKLMESALNFAGYEYTYKWDRSKHNIYHGTKLFPDAMRWLWRNHPHAPKVGKSLNNMLSSILIDGMNWEQISLNEFNNATYSNEKTTDSESITLNNGNCYTVNKKGEIRLKNKKEKYLKLNTLPTGGTKIAIYPDGKLLIQSERHSNWLISYTINEDGTLSNGEQFYWLHNTTNDAITEPSSMCFDTSGNLYIATVSGIQIADQNGRVRAILPSPEGNIISMKMRHNKIYIQTDSGKTFCRQLASKAHNPAEPPITPTSQGQG